ncbi:hypothetical protein [Kingella negevensis]|uniref:hypothetical protein n=1 Tax=Kingella negevensis TaxID=1522312 RepID=UPI00050A1F8D|nr:hypothetical protein [Kingella negevensis]MDK4689751.1 hypothetical protein [Kingella negevensis]
MKTWLIEIIHNIDILCNIIIFTVLAYKLSYIHAYRKYKVEPILNKTDLLIRRIWYIALVGLIFIPSKETLQIIFK